MLPGQNPSPNHGITPQAHTPLQQHLAALQEEMDTMRLNVKYLVFDLEATCRERDHATICAVGMARRVDRLNQILATYNRRYGGGS